MKIRIKSIIASVAVVSGLSFTNGAQIIKAAGHTTEQTTASKKVKKPAKKVVKKAKKTRKVRRHKTRFQPYADPTDMRKMSGNYWKYSSEKRRYPNLRKIKKLNLRVSIKGNRVYVRSGRKVVYTMYASCGMIRGGRSLTPRGVFRTNHYRPHRFSSAYYPTGWIGQLYLLHSVPTYLWSSRYNLTEARKLGRKPASHGCIRLSVSDAKWLHDHLPYRTKVVICYK